MNLFVNWPTLLLDQKKGEKKIQIKSSEQNLAIKKHEKKVFSFMNFIFWNLIIKNRAVAIIVWWKCLLINRNKRWIQQKKTDLCFLKHQLFLNSIYYSWILHDTTKLLIAPLFGVLVTIQSSVNRFLRQHFWCFLIFQVNFLLTMKVFDPKYVLFS